MGAVRARDRLAVLAASGAAWGLAVHVLLGAQLLAVLSFIALVGAAGFGLGYEMADGGAATALFLTMAVGGLMVTALWVVGRVPGPEVGVAFGTAPALIAAFGAHAGGELREGRQWS
jgi:hypothetical protein